MLKKKNTIINYDVNFFVNNPITIIYIKNDKETKKYKFNQENIKKGKWEANNFNTNYENILENINNLFNNELENNEDYFNLFEEKKDIILDIMLQKSEETQEVYKKYNIVYPFDSILDFKYKIQLLTGIEWFKLCLYWHDEEINELTSSYILYVNNFRYKINYNKFEYDNYLNKNKDNYFVKALDEFESMEHLFKKKNMVFYIRNIDDYIDRNTLLNNKYEVENMYYSFVLNFFPQFTYDLFYNYIYTYDDFKNKYNNLYNLNLELLKKEHLLVNKYINQYKYDVEKLDYRYLDFYFNDSLKQFIKLRNLFEILHINQDDIIYIYMKLGNETYRKRLKKNINVIKEYKSQENLTYNYIIIYLSNKYSSVPIFLRINENANMKISFTIDYTYNLTHENALTYLQEKINPIINKINKFKDILLLNSYLDEINMESINLILSKSNLTTTISNMLFINYENYNKIFNELSLYPHIFLNLTKDLDENISFNLKKGITSYNRNYFNILHPNINNYYSKYSILKDMENWDNSYRGINIKLIRNQNIITINYMSINEIDVPFVVYFINAFIKNIKLEDEKKTNLLEKISNKNIKKLNKLKMTDPVMYSFKKSKNSKKKYSKMCQKPFHPLVYTKEEYKYLDEKNKKKTVKYVNATNNEDVYYHCNNKDAPYLGFIVDEHPKNYCIPCCRVKEQKDKEFHNSCLKEHIVDVSKKTSAEKGDKKTIITDVDTKYILQNIEYKRYSNLSPNLNIFFNKFVKNKLNNKSNFYIYGLNDLNDIYKYIFEKDNNRLSILISDRNKNTNNSNYLFFQHELKVNVIIIDKYANLNIDNVFDYDEYFILYENNINSYYPIIELETDSKIKKLYKKEDTLINLFNELINKSNNKKDEKNIWSFNYINKKYNIKKLLINNRNLIYGAIIQFGNNKDDLVLYPIDYYYNNTEYPTFNIINNNSLKEITEANVIKFLKKTELIDDVKYYFKDSDDYYFALTLLNKKIFYFNQGKRKILDDIAAKYINFPLYLISEKILKNEIEYNISSLDYNIYYIYYKNLYKLILQEITYYFAYKKNIEKRNLLNKLLFTYIKDYNTFYKHIINIFKDERDIYKILNLFNILKNIDNISKNQISQLLLKIRFNFDDEDKNELIDNATYKKINELLDDVCVFIPKKDLEKQINKKVLQNILLPCLLETSHYCKGHKLLVPKEDKNNIIKLILNDLQNPIRKNIIFSIKMIIDDPYIFNVLPHEEVVII
jgi:hypothetical protein